MASKAKKGNVGKHDSYALAYDMINEAIDNHCPLQAIAIEESILTDRLFSTLNKGRTPSKEISKACLGDALKEWHPDDSIPETKRNPNRKLFDKEMEGLFADLNDWRLMRNKLLHSIAKSLQGKTTDVPAGEFREFAQYAAVKGLRLANVVKAWTQKHVRREKSRSRAIAQVLMAGLIVGIGWTAMGATWYVDCVKGSDLFEGTQKRPKASIQAAVNLASSGDDVLVATGSYSRIVVGDGVIVHSSHGREKTVIDGAGARAVELKGSAQLWGFIVENGYVSGSRKGGGGVLGGTVCDCVIRNCSSQVPYDSGYGGAGVSDCNVFDSVLTNNYAYCGGQYNNYGGGAAFNSNLIRCLISNNSADIGAALLGGGCRHCVIRNNNGELVRYAAAVNCTIYENTSVGGYSTPFRNCIIYSNRHQTVLDGLGCWIGQDPKFRDEGNLDLRLAVDSPCINAGLNDQVEVNEEDFEHNPRIADGTVDIGAYEFTRYDVVYDLQNCGERTGGGELTQKVVRDATTTPPTVEGVEGWVFMGWSADTTAPIVSNTTFTALYTPKVMGLSIAPDAGVFSEVAATVEIGCTNDYATILYTLDGSIPSAENGRIYKGPFAVYQTTTVKAIAVREGWVDSDVVSATYTKGNALSEGLNCLNILPDNDANAPWTVDTTVSHDGVSSVKSGAIVANGMTGMQISVKKAGRLSFWWRAKCEDPDPEDGPAGYYDYAALMIDDVDVAYLAGADTGWQQFVTNITSGGKHVIRWEYRKDNATTIPPDCVWVDRVQWLSATATDETDHTLTTETPVPYTWLDKYGLGRTTDFETAAKAKSGKADGAGRELTVEEEYIAGTDPTNMTSHLEARIEMVEGAPVVKWSPDWNEDGTKSLRDYKIWGKEALDDGSDWQYPTNALHRFFKVTVEMP